MNDQNQMPLSDLRQFIGRTETATDVVTASSIAKLAATLGVENPAITAGDPIPRGWHCPFFPPIYGPSAMRADGLAAGGEILPAVPLPRRRLRVVRNRFDDALRIGDEITCSSEIADISIEGEGDDAIVRAMVRDTISSPRGVAVVEELEYLFLGMSTQSSEPPPSAGEELVWHQSIDPNSVLLFRFSAVKFNSHRIHYDRDYATKVEGFPGLVVHGKLVAKLFIEMCRRELPHATMTTFGYERTTRPIFDTAPFIIAGAPASDGKSAEMWAIGPDEVVGFAATATFSG